MSDSIAGQYCGRLLADHGATVTLIEPPEGSPIRRAAPLSVDTPGESLMFRHLNAGKRSIAIDLAKTGAQRLRDELMSRADIIILPPGAARKEFAAIGAQTVVVRIDDFAPETSLGHWRGPEIVIQALSGMMHNNGAHGREPLYGYGERSAFAAGLAAYIGALAALYVRPTIGRGQDVLIDRAETAAAMAFPYVMQFLYSGHDRLRSELSITAGQALCRDGWVCIWIYNFRWRALCETLGLAHLISDPRFADPLTRKANWSALFEIIQSVVADRLADEVVDALQQAQVIAAKAPGLTELRDHPHLIARDYWRRAGDERILGPAWRFSRTPRGEIAPPPALDDTRMMRSAAE